MARVFLMTPACTGEAGECHQGNYLTLDLLAHDMAEASNYLQQPSLPRIHNSAQLCRNRVTIRLRPQPLLQTPKVVKLAEPVLHVAQALKLAIRRGGQQ